MRFFERQKMLQSAIVLVPCAIIALTMLKAHLRSSPENQPTEANAETAATRDTDPGEFNAVPGATETPTPTASAAINPGWTRLPAKVANKLPGSTVMDAWNQIHPDYGINAGRGRAVSEAEQAQALVSAGIPAAYRDGNKIISTIRIDLSEAQLNDPLQLHRACLIVSDALMRQGIETVEVDGSPVLLASIPLDRIVDVAGTTGVAAIALGQ